VFLEKKERDIPKENVEFLHIGRFTIRSARQGSGFKGIDKGSKGDSPRGGRTSSVRRKMSSVKAAEHK